MSLNRKFLTMLGFTIFFILLILVLATSSASQISTRTGEIVNAEASFLDMAFFSGEEVTIKANSNDDIFAAGGKIEVGETTADHLVLAGGEININDVQVDDVVAAGGDLNLKRGSVTDDILAAGGNVTIHPEFQISGSAVISGGEVTINAPIQKELRVAASRIVLNSAIGGNVKLMGDEIELGPKARLASNLQYRGPNILISPSAVISGTKSILPPNEHDEFERWGKGSAALFAGFAIAAVAGITILVVVIALLLPGLMNRASRLIRQKPLLALGIGFLATFALPFALFMLFVTIIGAPLAMLIAAMLFAFTPVAIAAFAYFLGMWGRKLVKKPMDDAPPPPLGARLTWSAIAIVLILALGMIPFVGGLVWLLALMFGMGAILVQGGQTLARNEE